MMCDGRKKPYVLAIVNELIYTVLFVVSKAALDLGMNSFVFTFYSQAAASLLLLPIALVFQRKNVSSLSPMLLLKLFFCALIGFTGNLNLSNLSMTFTSATVASAVINSDPALTFCLALLFRLELLELRSSSGRAKLGSVMLCVAGVLVIAFYAGPTLRSVNHHHAFAQQQAPSTSSRAKWITGTFLMALCSVTWSLWIVMQARLLKDYTNDMLVTVTQCVFSAVQPFVIAAVAERDFSKWKLRLDVSLIAILYSGFVVSGVSFYLQIWCMKMKGPVFVAMWTPICFVLTTFCSSFFLGENVQLGSIIGGVLLVGGLYSMLWGKSIDLKIPPRSDDNASNGIQDERITQEAPQEEAKTSEPTAEQV